MLYPGKLNLYISPPSGLFFRGFFEILVLNRGLVIMRKDFEEKKE